MFTKDAIIKFIVENQEMIHEMADAMYDIYTKYKGNLKIDNKVSTKNLIEEDDSDTKVCGVQLTKFDNEKIEKIQAAADEAMKTENMTLSLIINYVAKHTGFPFSYDAFLHHIDFGNYKYIKHNKALSTNIHNCISTKCLEKFNLPWKFIKALTGIKSCTRTYIAWKPTYNVTDKDIVDTYEEFKLYLNNFDKEYPRILNLSIVDECRKENTNEKISDNDLNKPEEFKQLSYYKYSPYCQFMFRDLEKYKKLIRVIEETIKIKDLSATEFKYNVCNSLGIIIPEHLFPGIMKSVRNDYNYEFKRRPNSNIQIEQLADYVCLIKNKMSPPYASVITKTTITAVYKFIKKQMNLEKDDAYQAAIGKADIDIVPSEMISNERLYNFYINHKEMIDNYCKENPRTFKIPEEPKSIQENKETEIKECLIETNTHPINTNSIVVPWPVFQQMKTSDLLLEEAQERSNIAEERDPAKEEQEEPKLIDEDQSDKKKQSKFMEMLLKGNNSSKSKQYKPFTLDMVTYDLVVKMVEAYDYILKNTNDYGDAAVRAVLKKTGAPDMQMWIARAILFGHKYIDEEYSSIPDLLYEPDTNQSNGRLVTLVSKVRWIRDHNKTFNETWELLKKDHTVYSKNEIIKAYYEGIYPQVKLISPQDEIVYNYKYFGIEPK